MLAQDFAPGSWISGCHGLSEHPNFQASPAFVRGFNHAGSGWILEPLAGPSQPEESPQTLPPGQRHPRHGGASEMQWTRVSYVVQSELRGWLPPAVVNSSMVGMYSTFFSDLIGQLSRASNVPQSKPLLVTCKADVNCKAHREPGTIFSFPPEWTEKNGVNRK